MAAPLAELEREIARQAGMAKGAAGTKVAGTKLMTGATGGAAATVGKGASLVGNAGLSGTAANGVPALASGTIWSGKGLSLGLGLGLGAWGPVLVLAAGAAATYAYLEYRRRQMGTDEEIEEEVQDEGFYPAQG